jgi:hypothetical protein
MGSEGSTQSFLTSATGGGELLDSYSGRFTPRKIATFNPLDRRLGGLQNQSKRYGEEKTSILTLIPTPAIEPIVQHYTD